MSEQTTKARYNVKPVKIGEKQFPSITEAWRTGAVKSYCKLRAYVANNKPTVDVDKDKRERSLVLNGVTYESVTKASKETDITINRIHAEITRSKSRDIVLTKDIGKKTRNCIPLTVNGVEYKSTREASKATGISQNTLQKKLLNNASRVITYLEDPRALPITVNGKEYPSMVKACLELGMCFATLSKYRREQGQSVNTTLTDF